uniref:Uncharacterized protein n=1 Tax=Panagrolaimus davidi TaxID=227884 RepID=A0A914QPH6_9BILA
MARLPTEEDFAVEAKPLLVLLDDCLTSSPTLEAYLEKLTTKQSHHQQLCVVIIVQNLFDKRIKVARNNSHYIICMRSPSAAHSLRVIGTHLFPNRLKYFLSAWEMATRELFSYLVIDQHPASHEMLRLRTSIFPPDDTVVFLPKA